jgi:vancomycin permeability regulator SanA
MSDKKNKYSIITITLLLLLQLAFLYYIKYANQELLIIDFSLSNIGNIFNLLIYLGLIMGVYISLRIKKSVVSVRTVFAFLSISSLLLIVAFISTKTKIFSDQVYLFALPANRVLTGLLFFLFLFAITYFLLLIWTSIMTRGKESSVRILYSTVLTFILFYIFIIIYIDNVSYTSGKWVLNKSKNNVAIVLGAAVWSGNIPSPTLSSRVDKALDLLDEGFVGKIVFTGGKAPGELSEAEVAYEYAKINGVDTSKVVKETFTSSTTDQIKWIKTNLSDDRGYGGDKIIISDSYHLARVIEISKFFNLDIKVAESMHKLDFKNALYNKIREGIALFNFWNFAL